MTTQARRDLRLEHLYEISKLFAGVDTNAQPFDAALRVVARTVKLRCAILAEQDEHQLRRTVWTEGVRVGRASRTHMSRTSAYLLASQPARADVVENPGATPLPRQRHGPRSDHAFIVLPLVLARRAPFGALLLEGAEPFTEPDLKFICAVTSQLAVALDQQRNWRHDIARRDEAEKAQAVAEHHRMVAEAAQAKSEALGVENARLYEEAQQAVRVREQVLAIVSHDLRSPLSTIMLSAGQLVERPPADERRVDVPIAAGRIQRASARMLRLIEDLLDFASIEAGKLAIRRQPEDAHLLIQEAAAGFNELAASSHVVLTAQAPGPLPAIWCDRDRLLQVLGNLLGNAIKVTAPRGEITLTATARPSDVVFAVADHGPGIRSDEVEHLFERYWRSGDARYRGTGLGLAIARGLVEAHGGTIWVQSTLGQGATFSFSVPTAKAAPGERPTQINLSNSESPSFHTGTPQ